MCSALVFEKERFSAQAIELLTSPKMKCFFNTHEFNELIKKMKGFLKLSPVLSTRWQTGLTMCSP
jgi:hypothetical protein